MVRHLHFFQIVVILIALLPLKSFCSDARKGEKKSRVTEKNFAEMSRKIRILEAEKANLERERKVLRKELLETLDKNTMLAGKLKRLEMSASGLLESLEADRLYRTGRDTAESLRTVMQSSVALASAAEKLCAELLLHMEKNKAKYDSVSAAKLRILVNSARTEIRKIAILHSPPAPTGAFTNCRVLNVDYQLHAAAVSAGYRNGVRTGMLLYTPDGKVVLRIVSVKNFVSGGIVVKGEIRDLAIGMELLPQASKKN